MTEVQAQYSSKSQRVLGAYRSFVDEIRAELPKIDVDLVLNMLRLNYKFKEERPRLHLEIIYAKNINANDKKDELLARMGRAGEVRDNHILIIDGYFTLQDVEALARDNQIQVIKGEIIYWYFSPPA